MQSKQSNLVCPRCLADVPRGGVAPRLFEVPTPGVTLHGCSRCGGVFLSQACATRLAAQLPALAIDVSARGSNQATHQPDLSRTLHCPRCNCAMTRTKVSAAGIELDHCAASSCGTWYDRDEIKCVTDAIRMSGWGGASRPGNAGLVAGAAVGAAAVGAVALGIAASHQQSLSSESRAEVAMDVVGGVAEVVTDGAVEVIAEGGGELVGGIFEVLGGLFSGL